MGPQNRPREAPRGDKKRHRKKKKEVIRQKEHQEANPRSNNEVFDSKNVAREPTKNWTVRLAECAGPLGRIIGGVRRDKKIN